VTRSARSLQRHFGIGLAGGFAAIVLASSGTWLAFASGDLAARQDARLLQAAATLQPAPGMLWAIEDAADLPPRGDTRLLRTHPAQGDTVEGPRLYFAQVDGQVMRAVLVRRAGDSHAQARFAESAALRVPGWRDFVAGPLPPLVAGAAAMAWVGWVCWRRARTWLARSLAQTAQQAGVQDVPAELAPTLQAAQALQSQQREWVEQQRRFLADAAHQLRTPMAVLRAELQEALHGEHDVRERLQGMLHTLDRATGVANHLLSLSRVEQLQRAGELGEIALAACVRDAIIELSPLLAAKRLEFSLDGDDFHAPGDAVMLGELLRNLLGNAIHHSAPGGRGGVVVRAATREVIVWDEGPGVADALKPRLFTPFSAGRGGVGLGLSICQQIAEAMGAQVSLYNRMEEGRVAGVDAVVRWAAPQP